MDEFNYEVVLSLITDIDNRVADYKKAKKDAVKIKRRIKSIKDKYNFLNKIIAKGCNDEILEFALKKLFLNAGYKRVERVSDKMKEDMRIWHEKQIIFIEATGTKNQTVTTGHATKLSEHIKYAHTDKKIHGFCVRGLSIMNNDFNRPPQNRKPPVTSKETINFAETSDIGIISTPDLFKGFLMLKSNNITFEKFHQAITQNGIIKF